MTAKRPPRASPRLTLRLEFSNGVRFGHGKATLLELIDVHGSISAAARELKMSYRRAWMLVEEMNTGFKSPVVEAAPGGRAGGHAVLTPLGRDLLARYRAIEVEATASLDAHATAFAAALPARTPRRKPA